MKCDNCGHVNKSSAKFCTKCGVPFNGSEVSKTSNASPQDSNKTKYIIIALVVIIVILVAAMGYYMGMSSNSSQNDASQEDSSSSVDDDSESSTTSSTSSSSKSWVLIGTYSGSGSGSQSVTVPSGQIMVKLSAYPIKNYATNYLHVSGSNGRSGGVDWGSQSAVETRSDSFTYTSSSSEVFSIDYYETVSWKVEFYKYQ